MAESKRIYLDQMLGIEVQKGLVAAGHDAVRAAERGQTRADDKQILDRAVSENRILVTLDDHFGDWVVLPLSRHSGVIRIRVHPATSQKVLDLLLPFLARYESRFFKNRLVILSQKREKWIRTAG